MVQFCNEREGSGAAMHNRAEGEGTKALWFIHLIWGRAIRAKYRGLGVKGLVQNCLNPNKTRNNNCCIIHVITHPYHGKLILKYAHFAVLL